ncbi:leucine-rich repeat extensin-like protein 3 [Iris pallida]|uniref:Leucine-rich repeat extensin-like protein 3 n=1 Tax=Iris pallida TaxID=29817 RepID=A0AAX6H3V1_IRIPA|nr:leucine-rich repeat extensin-like protein 3 [Iris pallida]KAJ6835241.1 leucine-rich repeat extensin-like protein 3 [Iris pallida]
MLFTQILGKERERKGLGTHRVRVRRSWWRRMRTRRSTAYDKGKRWGGRRQIWRWQRACGTTVAGGAIKLEGLGGSGLPAERVSSPAVEVEDDGAQVVAGKTPRGRPFANADRAEGWAHGGLVRRRRGGTHARWSSTGSGALRLAEEKSSGGAGSGGATAGCGVRNGLGVLKRQPRHVGAGQDGERGCRRWP